jgi:microcystin-dependent protein
MNRVNGGAAAAGPPAPQTGVPGTLDMWPLDTPPQGAYECNGQSISRTTDARLFGIIGTAYGAADPSTFKVPDMRGQFIRGWSHGSGVDPDAATRTNRGDGTAGDHVGTKQIDALRTHTHSFDASSLTTASGQNVISPDTGSYFGDEFSRAGPDVSEYFRAQQLGIVGSAAVGSSIPAGNETRPINVNMMIIIWR